MIAHLLLMLAVTIGIWLTVNALISVVVVVFVPKMTWLMGLWLWLALTIHPIKFHRYLRQNAKDNASG